MSKPAAAAAGSLPPFYLQSPTLKMVTVQNEKPVRLKMETHTAAAAAAAATTSLNKLIDKVV